MGLSNQMEEHDSRVDEGSQNSLDGDRKKGNQVKTPKDRRWGKEEGKEKNSR